MLPGNAGEHFAHAAFSDDTGFVFERPPATMALPIASMATMVTLRTCRIPFRCGANSDDCSETIALAV
jgi:hypothetical protein